MGRGRGEVFGFVVDREAFDDGLALRVEADEFDLGTLLAEFDHDLVEGVDRRGVPEMRVGDVDDHGFVGGFEVERFSEGRRGGEK